MLNEPLRGGVKEAFTGPVEVYANRFFRRPPIAPLRGRGALLLAAAVAFVLWHAGPGLLRFFVPEPTFGGRLRVSDGDSLSLDGVRVRLSGIDAPELAQTCRVAGADHPCGREARDHLVASIAGRPVVCAGAKLDKYRRRLGRCRAGDLDLNAEMVRSGWAVAYGAYEREEIEARIGRRGLWAGDFEWPEDFRREARARSAGGGWADWFERLWK